MCALQPRTVTETEEEMVYTDPVNFTNKTGPEQNVSSSILLVGTVPSITIRHFRGKSIGKS